MSVQQVGGSHYAALYQHWDWACDVKLGPMEYASTKYLCRWWNKNGFEDFKKSISYVQKAQEKYQHGYRNESLRTLWAMDKMDEFFLQAQIPPVERQLIKMIATWQDVDELQHIRGLLEEHLEAAVAAEAVQPMQPLRRTYMDRHRTAHEVHRAMPSGAVEVAFNKYGY